MEAYEYREFPEVDGVKRVTTDRLVLMQVSKDEAVKRIASELHGASFGGLYFLINSSDYKIYIGESSDIKDRIGQHTKKSSTSRFEFDKVSVIWDGRTRDTSHFNDNTMRLALEYECIKAFKTYSDYDTVNSQISPPDLSIYQKATTDKFKAELFFLLYKFHLLSQLPEDVGPSEELTVEQVQRLLEKNGFLIEKISGSDKVVTCRDGKKVFYRGGSLKRLGWQVTMRDTFLDEMLSGKEGVFFLLSRTEPYLIPAKVLKDNLEGLVERLTLDFFIDEKEKKLKCHNVNLDISSYRISYGFDLNHA